MGLQRISLRDVLGVLKDKASLSKAALLQPSTAYLHLAILRATTHRPSSPPHEKHVTVLLSFGESSRNIASTCIEALMDRLHKTHNSSVAFKCLITIHFIIRRGSFILQDQLSVYPSTGGRNYLNLSNFRDNCTSETWNLSLWVRWYARVLESLLLTFRVLGYFFCYEEKDERVTSLLNGDLIKEIDVLVSLIEEISYAPAQDFLSNKMVHEAITLIGQDCSIAQNELFIRISEFKARMDNLSFADSVELVCIFRRLENCKEKLTSMFLNRIGSIGDRLWVLTQEMKEMIGEGKDYGERKLVRIDDRKLRLCESARFEDRGVRLGDSINFSSRRLSLNQLPIPILECVESSF